VITTTQLEVLLARRRQDVAAAQALRYRVFYKEMGAAADLKTKVLRRDIDRFDRTCDHLLVINPARRRRRIPPLSGSVVGTCRLIRRTTAERRGGFYSADEFDLSPLLDQAGECLEVGRSCVAPDYRSRAVIDRVWSGIADYIRANRITLLFGCASLHGVSPSKLAQPLSDLYHHHLAPPPWRAAQFRSPTMRRAQRGQACAAGGRRDREARRGPPDRAVWSAEGHATCGVTQRALSLAPLRASASVVLSSTVTVAWWLIANTRRSAQAPSSSQSLHFR
jgi:putative hemolysin